MPFPPLERAALLVIDVQTGPFSAKPPPCDGAVVVERINTLAERAREASAPVILIQHENVADGMPHSSPQWQLYPGLKTGAADTRVRKTTCNCFYETLLEDFLRRAGVTTLVLTGYATDFCVDSTFHAAVDKGFEVVVASDAHTTHDGPTLEAERVRRHHNWAWSECTASKPVRVAPAEEIRFRKA